jgi:lipoyl(octanoyl) transferase
MPNLMTPCVQLRQLGLVAYGAALGNMRRFTDTRGPDTADEIWFLEHPPVFTLGVSADVAHLLKTGDIPVERADRGGQVTYHGPGQLVVYTLLDLRRARLGIRELVSALENSAVATIAGYGIPGESRRDAPGVYVDGAKIASIGLRVRHGCSYHGLALNVAMNLEPFERIHPCGFERLEVTQISALGGPVEVRQVARDFQAQLLRRLGLKKPRSGG